jgi:hypothetical protein
MVKKLQALCYWAHDHQKCGQVIDHNDWGEDMVQVMIEMIHIERGRDTGNVRFRTWAGSTLVASLRLMRWHL